MGVPEGTCTSTDKPVICIGEATNVNIKPEDIQISHKLKRKNSKPVIVKFLSHKVKSLFYKVRTKLKNVKISDLLPSYAYASRKVQRIFINENLTNYQRDLFWKANKLKKVSTWTMDGKLFVKTSPSRAPVRIYNEEDLEDL